MSAPTARRGVSIVLSDEQIEQVVESHERNRANKRAFGRLTEPAPTSAIELSLLDDASLSRSLLSGLLVLAVFPEDATYIGNSDVAQALNMSLTTSHRYISTLLAAGLLERDPQTRKYRRA
jgi:DNA-binding MarR family transcriptional regulator